MFDRRLLTNFDWPLLTAVCLLIICGTVQIYSATHNAPSAATRGLYQKQIWWAIFGLIALLITISIDYHRLIRYGIFFYILDNLLLIYVLVAGGVRAGVSRWINFMGISIQPSEFSKVILILILAGYLSRHQPEDIGLREIICLLILLGIPLGLVVKQPDLGSALMLLPIFMIMLLVAEVPLRWLILLVVCGLGAIPIIWRHLKPYQVNRILSFAKPNLDPLGIGYQVLQSKIAVGSGGALGRGFLAGTQSQLRFIPQHHTDFIFSVLAEEWGFLGCIVVIGLFLFLILKGIDCALHAKDRLGTIMAMGVISMFAFHVITNVGMVVGLMPVTGIPLPFLSYGGTSLLTNMVAVGILLNIRMRRFS
ncbi:MAG: rod shape-determining protein RodA [bacterium]|nr:rod shape-determining protein RodA [bacterium]